MYKSFVKSQFQKQKGTPQQRMKKIALLWKKHKGSGLEEDIGFRKEEQLLQEQGLDKYSSKAITEQLEKIEKKDKKEKLKQDLVEPQTLTKLIKFEGYKPSMINLQQKLIDEGLTINEATVKPLRFGRVKYTFDVSSDTKNKKIEVKKPRGNASITTSAPVKSIPKDVSVKVIKEAKKIRHRGAGDDDAPQEEPKQEQQEEKQEEIKYDEGYPKTGHEKVENVLLDYGLDKYATRNVIEMLDEKEKKDITENKTKKIFDILNKPKFTTVIDSVRMYPRRHKEKTQVLKPPSILKLYDKLKNVDYSLSFVDVKRIKGNKKQYTVSMGDEQGRTGEDLRESTHIIVKAPIQEGERIKNYTRLINIPSDISYEIIKKAYKLRGKSYPTRKTQFGNGIKRRK